VNVYKTGAASTEEPIPAKKSTASILSELPPRTSQE
jgi:hypothetical protein